MPRRDETHLLDILEAVEEMSEYVSGADRQSFETNRMMRRAVLYLLAIIGEACNRLSSDFQARHSHIPWRDIVGMRNVLVHEYGAVDLDLAWAAATVRAPELAEQVARILDNDEGR